MRRRQGAVALLALSVALRALSRLPVSLQALPYVCLLIAMLFFIYAIIGMQVGVCRAIA